MDYTEYWKEGIAAVIALFTSGATGGVLGKRLVDKEQTNRIKSLEEQMKTIKPLVYQNENTLNLLKKDVDANTERDREFRNEMKSDISMLANKIDRLGDYLLNQKNR